MARALAQCLTLCCSFKPISRRQFLIDEVQKAPELFEQIKIICDESDEKGLNRG